MADYLWAAAILLGTYGAVLLALVLLTFLKGVLA